VSWAVVPNPLGLPLETRYQVPNAAIFKGGEGCWYDDGVVFFTCKGSNRVWQYDTVAERCDVIYDGPRSARTPCSRGRQHHRAHAVAGPARRRGRRQHGAGHRDGRHRDVAPFLRYPVKDSEIAGPAFTADGTRLYFSSQAKNVLPLGGETFEITGPFRGAQPAPSPAPSAVPSPSSLG
jgi:hypothetical protein